MDSGPPDASGFATRLVASLRAQPAMFVVLPPGREALTAVKALRAAAPDHEHFTIDTPAGGTDFYVLLGDAFPYGAPVRDIDSFILAAGDLHQPRLVTLVGAITDDPATLTEHMKLAGAATRDMAGPWRFVCLVAGAAAPGMPGPFHAWPPDWRDVPQVSFDDGSEEALRQALAHFIDRRIYWESAGQPDAMAALLDRLEMQSSLHPASRQIDETINRVFDAAPLQSDGLESMLANVAGSAPGFWSKALRQDLLPRCDSRMFLNLRATGGAWQPPGMLHGRLTPLALRTIAANPGLSDSGGLTPDQALVRLRRARVNAQVAHMVLTLTAQVEQDLLDALRDRRDWPELCRRAGVEDDLEAARRRTIGSPGPPTSEELIEYATFGQLARIAEAAGNSLRFPLPRERVWMICHLRNRAAHGHGIGWADLSLAIQSVADLAENTVPS